MKHFMTTLLCLFAMNMSAQTGFVEFPYNPDSDGDDLIGTADLLDLLSLFGSEFSEEDLYINQDSTSAVINLGSMAYPKCLYQCSQLPGFWRLAETTDFGMIWDEFTSDNDNSGWIGNIDISTGNLVGGGVPAYYGYGYSGSNGGGNTYSFHVYASNYTATDARDCYCATHERPKVEYSYCNGEKCS